MGEHGYKFNYHEVSAKERRGIEDFDTFMAWFSVSIMSDVIRSPEFGDLSDATNKFTECEFTIFLNGMEMDAETWLRNLDGRMESYAKQVAERMLKEKFEALINKLRDQQEKFEGLFDEAYSQLRQDFRKMGVNTDWMDD